MATTTELLERVYCVVIPSSNISFMWDVVVNPRVGSTYVFGGTLSPNNTSAGTDCSGAVGAVIEALTYGPSMSWARPFWTGTFAGLQPGQTGDLGLVCVASLSDVPSDAACIVAILQTPDPSTSHMVCQAPAPGSTSAVTNGIAIEDGGPNAGLTVGAKATSVANSEFNQILYLPGPIVTTVNGVDYSGGLPGGAAIAAAGYGFACRYVFDGSPSLPNKLLTAAEASDLQAHGVDVVSNWESTANAALNGFNQGASDAQGANVNHLAAGGPPDRPIYFSVDFDEAASQDPAIDAYFQGVASVIGLARTGAYGGYWVISRLFNAGLITYGWQTEAWSGDPAGLAPAGPDGDYLDPRVNILQRNAAGFVNIGGVQCDVDVAYTADYGQWGYSGGGAPVVTDQSEQQQIQDIHDKIMAYPEDPSIAGKWQSRAMFVSGANGVDDTVGMGLNADGNGFNSVVILGYLAGAASDVAIVEAAAAGQFPAGSYVANNPSLQARATDFAKALIQFRSQIVGALAPILTPAVVPPAPFVPAPVAPAPVTPAVNPVMNITVSQLLQWGKDAMAVVGALATWATSVHSMLGQYLPGAAGSAVPLTLAALTAGAAGHSVHQKRVALRALDQS